MTEITGRIRTNDRAYLLVRNPSSVFVCWTWSPASAEAFRSGTYSGEVLVRLTASDDRNISAEASVPWDSQRLFMKPPAEGRSCTAFVYASRKDGSREKLLESPSVLTPVASALPGLSSGYASSEFLQDAKL
ncbi:MAG TPA: DUF4912 domain-containing protein [Elusimicrobiales bacterium]|nr:DUF4912 domain-containing protein [Elusimicrobiales bacterium]